MTAPRGIWTRAANGRAGFTLAALAVALGTVGAAQATVIHDGNGANKISASGDAAAAVQFSAPPVIDTTAVAESEPEAPALGMTALAEALRDDAQISAILRDIMPDGLAIMPGERDANLPQPRASMAFAQPGAESDRATEAPDAADEDLEVDDGGRVSLRQVLQAIRGPDLGGRGSQQAASGHADADDPDDDIDVRRQLLDNRFLGEALAQIVEVDSVDGSFSIFGMGHFTLASHNSMNDAVTDSSFNTSDTDLTQRALLPQHGKDTRVDLLALLFAFLETPAGELVAGLLATALVAWSTTRIAGRPRR